MTPEKLRAYVIIFTGDIVPSLLAIYIVVYTISTRQFQPWYLPLVAGLAGVPLVRPRAGGPEDYDPPLPPAAVVTPGDE